MKNILLLTILLATGLFAAETNQYSYQNQQRAYEEAKENGDMKQHQYRKGDGSGDGQQHRYGQNNGQGGGKHKGGRH